MTGSGQQLLHLHRIALTAHKPVDLGELPDRLTDRLVPGIKFPAPDRQAALEQLIGFLMGAATVSSNHRPIVEWRFDQLNRCEDHLDCNRLPILDEFFRVAV